MQLLIQLVSDPHQALHVPQEFRYTLSVMRVIHFRIIDSFDGQSMNAPLNQSRVWVMRFAYILILDVFKKLQ